MIVIRLVTVSDRKISVYSTVKAANNVWKKNINLKLFQIVFGNYLVLSFSFEYEISYIGAMWVSRVSRDAVFY